MSGNTVVILELVLLIGIVVWVMLRKKKSCTEQYDEMQLKIRAEGYRIGFFTALALLSCREDPAAYIRPFAVREYVLAVLFLSVGCSVLSYFLSGYAIGRLSVARQTVFANLTTAVSIFAGTVFLHEPFTWLTLLFCLLILGGIFGVQAAGNRTAP